MNSDDLDTFEGTLFGANVKHTMSEAGASSSDLYKVPVDSIRVLPNFNVRIKDEAYRAHIRQLADSIKANGFFNHHPLAGYAAVEGDENVIYVTDGHCRLEATKLAISEGAPIEKLPVVMAPKGTSLEDLTFELLTTKTDKPLTIMEEAIVMKRLIRFGQEPKDIASRLGCGVAKVEERLLFISMPKSVVDAVNDGTTSYTNAMALYRQHGSKVEQMLKELAAQRDAQVKADPAKKLSKRVMPSLDPAQVLRKALTKHQADMFAALQLLLADPAFQSLDAELQHQVDMVVRKVKNASPDASAAGSSATAPNATNVVALSRAA